MAESKKRVDDDAIERAFGEENRGRLIDEYFGQRSEEDLTPDKAWQHVYRLLLWVDPTIGLAHCYESDKSQPGKPWYPRSLAFHDWLATALDAQPQTLSEHIDWLFVRAAEDLAADVVRRSEALGKKAAEQRAPYEGRGFPQPGQDPELIDLIRDVLAGHMASEPDERDWVKLAQRIRQYLKQENKRKNLLGEGFEDVLAQIIRRTVRDDQLEVMVRRPLHSLPGFNRGKRDDEKDHKVDVTVVRPPMDRRILITSKWSVRADRENQFRTDFEHYIEAHSVNRPFEYVLITNEFDPARLKRACEQIHGSKLLFDHVLHINPAGVKAAYGERSAKKTAMPFVLDAIDRGRLTGLGDWLASLSQA